MALVRVLNNNRNPGPDDTPKSAPPFGDGLVTRRFRATNENPLPGDCDVAFLQSAYRTVVAHLKEDTSREHGGLLLGLELPAPGGGRTVFVLHALPGAGTKGSSVSLTFTPETWTEFDRLTEAYDKTGLRLRRVGWYHSHPRIAIFLSQWDLDVCQDFDRPTDVALVVDPVGNRGAFFVRGTAGYRPGSPQGFVEVCDLHPETVVTWDNVTAVTSPAPLPHPPVGPPRPAPVPDPAPAPVTPTGIAPPPPTNWWPTIAAGIVAAVGLIGWGSSWSDLQKANGLVNSLNEETGKLNKTVDRAKAAQFQAEQQAQIKEGQRLIAEEKAQQAAARQAQLAQEALAAREEKAKEAEQAQAEFEREHKAALAKLRKKLGLPEKP